ncbi:MAG: DUF952 domain-containing protein [Paracoccaceae bacterium]
MLIYKVFTEEENNLFISNGYTNGSQADYRDGFIHLSARHQLLDTINKHFNHLKTIYIFSFYINSLDKNLKWEKSRNEEYFPHYYAHLLLEDNIYALKIKN